MPRWLLLLPSLKVPTDRPLGIVYCHKAGHRIIPERIRQLVTIPHMRMVPVFLVLTDVYSIDDEALSEYRSVSTRPYTNTRRA